MVLVAHAIKSQVGPSCTHYKGPRLVLAAHTILYSKGPRLALIAHAKGPWLVLVAHSLKVPGWYPLLSILRGPRFVSVVV